MKILLDECLPLDFRHSLPSHEVHTAEWAGMKGKTNGELLLAAEAAGYDLLPLVDEIIHALESIQPRRTGGDSVRTPNSQSPSPNP
jgi:hypothetical protein